MQHNTIRTGSKQGEARVYRGRVMWFNLRRGYGFISRSDGGGDCFVHHKDLAGVFGYLHEGEEVEFEIRKMSRGDKAFHVRHVDRMSNS